VTFTSCRIYGNRPLSEEMAAVSLSGLVQ